MVYFMDLFFAAAAFILGTVIGSYLNVCIYRIPLGISTAEGRSHCTDCGNTIAWYDLVPILSYILLRGKCRACKAKISPRYMTVELLTGVCFLLAFIVFGLSLRTPLTFVVLACLITAGFIDAEHKLLPDRFAVIIFAMGIINVFVSGEGYLSHIIGLFAVSVPFFLIALLTGGMGGGDVKLMAAAGLFLGWKNAVLAVIIGSVVGAAVAVVLLAKKKAGRKSEIPFGPFLALGCGAAALFGSRIIEWYLNLF